MIYCCGKYFKNTDKKELISVGNRPKRILEFGTCPHCDSLIAELTETIKFRSKPFKTRKRNKKAKDLINKCLSDNYNDIEKDVKYGTKNNMYWNYQLNGIIKDFNGEKRGECKTDLFIDTFDAPNSPGAFHY